MRGISAALALVPLAISAAHIDLENPPHKRALAINSQILCTFLPFCQSTITSTATATTTTTLAPVTLTSTAVATVISTSFTTVTTNIPGVASTTTTVGTLTEIIVSTCSGTASTITLSPSASSTSTTSSSTSTSSSSTATGPPIPTSAGYNAVIKVYDMSTGSANWLGYLSNSIRLTNFDNTGDPDCYTATYVTSRYIVSDTGFSGRWYANYVAKYDKYEMYEPNTAANTSRPAFGFSRLSSSGDQTLSPANVGYLGKGISSNFAFGDNYALADCLLGQTDPPTAGAFESMVWGIDTGNLTLYAYWGIPGLYDSFTYSPMPIWMSTINGTYISPAPISSQDIPLQLQLWHPGT